MKTFSQISRSSLPKLFLAPLRSNSAHDQEYKHGYTCLLATTTLSFVQKAVTPCVISKRNEPTTARTSSSVSPKKGRTFVMSMLPLDIYVRRVEREMYQEDGHKVSRHTAKSQHTCCPGISIWLVGRWQGIY